MQVKGNIAAVKFQTAANNRFQNSGCNRQTVADGTEQTVLRDFQNSVAQLVVPVFRRVTRFFNGVYDFLFNTVEKIGFGDGSFNIVFFIGINVNVITAGIVRF